MSTATTMIVLIWLGVALIALVLYIRQLYSKLASMELHHRPPVPLLGNMAKVIFRQEHMTTTVQKSYSAYPEDRMVGHYEFLNPVVLIRDPELLKHVAVKDFEHFIDRKLVGDVGDTIFGRNLLFLKGDEWKAMRSTLSPAFTSSKIRLMVPFMLEVCDKMINLINNKIDNSKDDFVDLDIKNLATRFANDVIATCAFGLNVSSQEQDNAFYTKSRELTTVTFGKFVKFIFMRSFPTLAKKLQLGGVSDDAGEFFSTVVLGTMKTRERQSIIRNDMIHLLMEAKKGQLSHDSSADAPAGFATVEESNVGKKKNEREWTDNDLVAQAVLFVFAGFETVSTAISFLLHELALHPEVQEKLVQEIRENDERNGGKFEYNSIQNMVYMDMVISEVLRMWPPAPMLDRLCVKDYNAGRPNKQATKDFIVPRGSALTIPVFSFHRDPQYFPEPNKFDPERFSEENRHKIKPFTYMPFGLGPRNCIGSRFALCEVKVMIYHLLKHVEVSPCPKTSVPSMLARDSMAMKLAGGHWLRFRLRN